MALDPLEIGVIVVMALVLFIWGPQKIPEVARAIGKARKEFDDASKDLRSLTNTLMAPVGPGTPSQGQGLLPQPAAPAASTGDQVLIDTARRIGIATQGKTREQIQAEIVALAGKAGPAEPPAG